ncbi:MAG: vWA domain-containing protein, partial [Actinomycetes bacterium]
DGGAAGAGRPAPEQTTAPTPTGTARLMTLPGVGRGTLGRHSRAHTTEGRTTGAQVPSGPVGQLHLTATLSAAAPYQRQRGRRGPGLVLRAPDLRTAVHEGREQNLVLFVVDASGSMGARQRMGAVKGAVLALLRDAYQRRDKVGLVTFRGNEAELVLPPTSSVEAGVARMSALTVGGRSPLAAGLVLAGRVLSRERLKDPHRRALVVLVTDGRATGTGHPLEDAYRAGRMLAGSGGYALVVDCEDGPVRLGLCAKVAAHLQAPCVRLGELQSTALANLVRAVRTPGAVA